MTVISEYTRTIAFNAMCIHECLNEAEEGVWPGYDNMRAKYGICASRDACIDLGEEAETLFNLSGIDTPFDFEFIPVYLRYFTTAADGATDQLKSRLKYSPGVDLTVPARILRTYFELDVARGMARQSLKNIREGNPPSWQPRAILESLTRRASDMQNEWLVADLQKEAQNNPVLGELGL